LSFCIFDCCMQFCCFFEMRFWVKIIWFCFAFFGVWSISYITCGSGTSVRVWMDAASDGGKSRWQP
jgi:hypothetical protein